MCMLIYGHTWPPPLIASLLAFQIISVSSTVINSLLPYCTIDFVYVLYVVSRTFLKHPHLLYTSHFNGVFVMLFQLLCQKGFSLLVFCWIWPQDIYSFGFSWWFHCWTLLKHWVEYGLRRRFGSWFSKYLLEYHFQYTSLEV